MLFLNAVQSTLNSDNTTEKHAPVEQGVNYPPAIAVLQQPVLKQPAAYGKRPAVPVIVFVRACV